MKCPNCLKEFNGYSCPYCGEEVLVEKKQNIPLSKLTIILFIVSSILILLSFAFSYLSIIGLCMCLITLYFSLKEENKKKAVSINLFLGVLSLITIFSFLNPFFDKWFSSKRLENTLQIDLPNGKAIEYSYDNGFKNNNISYVYYKYELNEDEYEKIMNDSRLIEFGNQWYITNVSKSKSDFIIYDYNDGEFIEPNNKLNYRYIFVQIQKVDDYYYAYIYKVAKRRY